MATTNVGYVGLDHHHCEPYLQSLDALPVEVTCACEPDPEFPVESVAELGEVPVYTDVEDLLDDAAVDVLWITLSNRDAPSVIRTALERDVDVYTEKPVARTAAELEPILAEDAASDATVGVSYTWRGHPISEDLKELAERGFFGDVRAWEARFVASKLAARNADHYLFEKAASRGGIVQWLGVHWLDLVPWLLDDPVTRVSATMESRTPGVDVEDGATVQLETESGARGTLQCGFYLDEGRYDTMVNVYGTGGASRWDPMGETFGFDGETNLELSSTDERWGGTPRRTITHEYRPKSGYGGQWGLEFMRQFLSAREEPNVDVPADLDDAYRVLEVLDAIYESARTRQWVPVGAGTAG